MFPKLNICYLDKKNKTIDFQNLKINIGSEVLERIGFDCPTKSYKFVGHHLDEHVTWEPHISHVHSKLVSANFIINSSKNIIPKNLRILL